MRLYGVWNLSRRVSQSLVCLVLLPLLVLAACGGTTSSSTGNMPTATANNANISNSPVSTLSVPLGPGVVVGHMHPGMQGTEFWNTSEQDSLPKGHEKDIMISSVSDPFGGGTKVLMVQESHFGSVPDIYRHTEAGIYFYETIQDNVNSAIPPEFHHKGGPYDLTGQTETCTIAVPNAIASFVILYFELKNATIFANDRLKASIKSGWFSVALPVGKTGTGLTIESGFDPHEVMAMLFYLEASGVHDYTGPILYVKDCTFRAVF